MSSIVVKSEITGNVWLVETSVGVAVKAGTRLLVLESMKMEIEVVSPVAGIVREVHVVPTETVKEGGALVTIELSPP